MPYHDIRLQTFANENDLLICGGEDHKTGQDDKEDISQTERYSRLESWLRERFNNLKDVVYKWSGQVMEPLDAMGFIGKNPGSKHIYIVTGDSGKRITHGTIAGILLNDLILENKNSWEKLYDPSRITLKVTGDFISEAVNMVAQYGDNIARGSVNSEEELSAGEGS